MDWGLKVFAVLPVQNWMRHIEVSCWSHIDSEVSLIFPTYWLIQRSLLLLLQVDRRLNVSVADWVNLVVILHKKSLRIDPTVMDDILSSSIVAIEISQIIADLNRVF